jgi:putative transposase
MNTRELTETQERTPEGPAVVFEELESWVRSQVQRFIQGLLEEEVTDLLGRRKSERRENSEAANGYRNGYGKERKLTMSCGTIKIRRPRVSHLEQRFESRVLPLFVNRTKEVRDLLPELYLHGLAQGDFELALRGLLGDEAPLSEATIARLKTKWQAEYEEWSNRRLDDLEVVYLWVDGIYVKAGLEKEKACLQVALAGLTDGRKVFIAIQPGHRESTESWSEMLRRLKARGLKAPRVVVGDGHLGIWAALGNVWPEVDEQRCWNHRMLNLLDKVSKKRQAQAKMLLKEMMYAPTVKQAVRLKGVFQAWCRKYGLDDAARLIDRDWDRMVTYYQYPKEHWVHLRTTNPVESPFSRVRLRTDASRRYKKAENATALIWKTMMISERHFRRLNAPELLADVYSGMQYADGVRLKSVETDSIKREEVAA